MISVVVLVGRLHLAELLRSYRMTLTDHLLTEALADEAFAGKQVNEKLDNRLQKYKAVAAGSNMVEKVVHLETELAEAMEANNMYKSQLRR